MVAALHEPHSPTAGLHAVSAALDEVGIEDWDQLDPTSLRQAITQIARLESRLAAHKAAAARVLDASGAAKRAGATSTGDLLARNGGPPTQGA